MSRRYWVICDRSMDFTECYTSACNVINMLRFSRLVTDLCGKLTKFFSLWMISLIYLKIFHEDRNNVIVKGLLPNDENTSNIQHTTLQHTTPNLPVDQIWCHPIVCNQPGPKTECRRIQEENNSLRESIGYSIDVGLF